MAATTVLKKISKIPYKSELNSGKNECTSVLKWKGITLKEFDFGTFQYISIKYV